MKMVTESIQLKERIQIYSSMLGCKKNLQKLIAEMTSRSIESYTTTEFVQGKTMRWGIAWSFKHDLRTFKNSTALLKKPSTTKKVLSYEIPTADFQETTARLRTIFDALKITIKTIDESSLNQFVQWELLVKCNTWSNERRKRRAGQTQVSLSRQEEKSDPNQELCIGFELRLIKTIAQLQMFHISGNTDKDWINQILQYIKNKFK